MIFRIKNLIQGNLFCLSYEYFSEILAIDKRVEF